CGDTAYLKVNNANAGSNYFWYTQPNGVNISRGTSVKTPNIPANKTYQVTSGTRGTIGLSSKYVFTGGAGGSYLTSSTTNYMIYNAAVPVILESARIYSRFGGKVNIYAADLNNSTFTFLTSTSLDVYTTSNNPAPGSASNDNTDTGAVFQINLPLPSGTHNLLVIPQGNANIFRNNNIPSSNATYPMSIPNLITITGNGATTPNAFYYYLYDMKIRTQECVSNNTAVVGTEAPIPTITRNGANLISSSNIGNQWYNGSTLLVGATNATYTPTSSGTYAVVVTDSDGCSKRSADFSFTLLPVQLQAFKGKMVNGVNNLDWETANEINSAYFIIEYSTDGNSFAECGKVKSAGNSHIMQSYSFQHLPGNQLSKHYYRLKMVDNDGSFNYSPVVVIDGIAGNKKLSFYPNPVRKNQPIQLLWNQIPAGKYEIQLLNSVGKQIAIQSININSSFGNMNILLPTENLTKGFYLIQVIGSQIKEVQKVWIE
ncbi:MAG: T9SS type A sorting domain-containing protein, partial [Chitinophagaceae bacterium]